MSVKTYDSIKGMKLYAITILRILIDWHFLFEGISKLFSPGWSSADFLSLSGWRFSGFFLSMAESTTFINEHWKRGKNKIQFISDCIGFKRDEIACKRNSVDFH